MKNLGQFLSEPEELPNQDTEDRLRKLFDFPEMIQNNIIDIIRRLQPLNVKMEKSIAADTYFTKSILAVDPRYVSFTVEGPDHHYVVHYGNISWLRQSKKYLENRKKLLGFAASITLPRPIRNAIIDLNKTIDNNTNLFVPTMNEFFDKDPKYILISNDSNTRYSQVAVNTFFERCKPLKPNVDKILELMRKYLDVRS